MNVNALIDALGGTTATAKLALVRPPSVHEWRERGRIPDGRLVLLAGEAERRGVAKRWELMPGVWHVIWPELIGTPGAPPVPANAAEEVRCAA